MMAKPSNTARGYGYAHQRLRKYWAAIVRTGTVTCTRYGHPLFPDCPGRITPGTAWHLGHDDWDRGRYTGPEHAACNVRAVRLQEQGRLNREAQPRSRKW